MRLIEWSVVGCQVLSPKLVWKIITIIKATRFARRTARSVGCNKKGGRYAVSFDLLSCG